jgi:hypothetical protein
MGVVSVANGEKIKLQAILNITRRGSARKF